MAERDDVRLTQDIRDELDRVIDASDAHILVRVDDGAVVVTGHVPNYVDKLLADEAVSRVAGVRAVANELSVRIPERYRPNDPDLAEAAAHALNWNAAVPDSVRAVVRGGWVTLEGEVTRQGERLAAERAVSMLVGVSGVTNQIRVRSTAVAGELQANVERALARSAFVDEHHVRVHVHNTSVTLRGIARSWAERSEAERLAWMTPGVGLVENQISVGLPATPDAWGPTLDAIDGSGLLPSDVAADDAARAVLCALALRMTRAQAQEFAGRLPGELGRVFHPCARHRRMATEPIDRDAFLHHVAEHVLVTPEEAALVARAVFAALRHRVPAADVANKLPRDLEELWPPAA
jgi:osmotically-inducible protein OsmY/uncharacterized protein (DUF2267 family)